jgi:hypothetical protein
MAMSAPTDTRPTAIVADGPEGRLLEAEEPGKGFWGYIRLVYTELNDYFRVKHSIVFFSHCEVQRLMTARSSSRQLMEKPSLPEKTNYPSLLLIFQEHTHIR